MTTDSREIVQRTGGGALAKRDELDAYQQTVPDDLILPVVKLVQGVSRQAESKRAGEFWNTVTHEYTAELRITLLAMSRSRALFGEGFDAPPLCVSSDAMTPTQQVEIEDRLTGPTCKLCPFSQFGTAKGGAGKGQDCRFSYNLLCMDPIEQQPFILRVSGTSLKAWQEYLTAMVMRRVPAYTHELLVGSEQRTFDAGMAYVMTFAVGNPLPAEFAEEMRAQAASYRGVSLGVEPALPESDDLPFE